MVVSFTQYYVNGNISFSGDVSAGLFTDNWLLGYTNVITSPMMYEFVIGMFLSEIFTNINESKSIKGYFQSIRFKYYGFHVVYP